MIAGDKVARVGFSHNSPATSGLPKYMKEETLKLFVWEDVLCDYTCGMVCILAHNLGEALELARKKYEQYYLDDFAGKKPKIITEPEAFAVYGGG